MRAEGCVLRELVHVLCVTRPTGLRAANLAKLQKTFLAHCKVVEEHWKSSVKIAEDMEAVYPASGPIAAALQVPARCVQCLTRRIGETPPTRPAPAADAH